MSEDETHVTTYPQHPILIPWYRCKVNSFAPSDENTLMIWLDYQNFLYEALSERKAEKEENQ